MFLTLPLTCHVMSTTLSLTRYLGFRERFGRQFNRDQISPPGARYSICRDMIHIGTLTRYPVKTCFYNLEKCSAIVASWRGGGQLPPSKNFLCCPKILLQKKSKKGLEIFSFGGRIGKIISEQPYGNLQVLARRPFKTTMPLVREDQLVYLLDSVNRPLNVMLMLLLVVVVM